MRKALFTTRGAQGALKGHKGLRLRPHDAKHPKPTSFAENARQNAKKSPSCFPAKPRPSCTKGNRDTKAFMKGIFRPQHPEKCPTKHSRWKYFGAEHPRSVITFSTKESSWRNLAVFLQSRLPRKSVGLCVLERSREMKNAPVVGAICSPFAHS